MPYIEDPNNPGKVMYVTADDPRLTEESIVGASYESVAGSTTGGTAVSSQVSVEDVLAMFAAAGVDPSVHADGSYEDPGVRAARIADEINRGERTTAEVQQAIARIGGLGQQPVGDIDALVEQVRAMFEAAGVPIATAVESEQDRLLRIAGQIAAGERTIAEVQTAIQGIAAGEIGFDPTAGGEFGGTGAGGISDLFGGTFPGVVTIGDTTIPQGATLVIIEPRGGAQGRRYLAAYPNVFGMTVYLEIGDQTRFDDLWPSGTASFRNVETMTEDEYRARLDEPGAVEGGSIDPYLGATESLQATIDREMRLLGMEDLAPWLGDSPEAMALVAAAAVEGWSVGRLWQEISKLDSYKTRFGAIDVYLSQGMNVQEATEAYIQHEEELRAGIRRFRGGTFTVTQEYLADLIETGWTADAAVPVLEMEARLKRNPDALAQANVILTASGLAPIDESGMIQVMQGVAPPDVTEALNTAAAATAIQEAGLEGLDTDLLLDVIDDTSQLRTPEDYQGLAQELAFNAARYSRELAQQRYGMDVEALTRAIFGGEMTGETFNTLAKIERERQAAAAGFENVSAFIDQRNRLRFQGFAGL